MASTATALADTYAFKAITAVDGSGLLLLSASNIATGTLAVARGGTGQNTFGGTNRLLFTTAADALSSIATANSSILATNGSGLPAWTTTLPAVNGSAVTNLSAANVSAGTLAVARGGTGLGTFGGTNTILYTSAADTLASIVTANSSVFVTSAGGVPSWSTTLPAVSGANLTSLNAGNISTGTLVVGRGGTGVTTFGGTNRLLYTTAADALSSIATANSSVLVTSGAGAPSWSTTLPAVNGSAITSLSAANISTGTLAVARGGTGVTTFGGANTVLFTTAADTLSSVTAANNSVLISGGTGTPSWSTTLPTIGKVTVSSADGTAFQGAFTRSSGFNKCFNAHGAGMLNGDFAQFSWGRSLNPNESAELNFVYDSGGNSNVGFGIYGSPGIFTIYNDGTCAVGSALKLASFTVASLPAGIAGRIVFASNGRKNGEGAGAGSGTLVYADGSAWRRVSDDTTVAA
jgi:hypothetical protein